MDAFTLSSQPIGDWVFNRKVGSGQFGDVTLWINQKTNHELAVKASRRMKEAVHPKMCEYWLEEVNMLKKIDHPNIVKWLAIPGEIAALLAKHSDMPLLGMEYCEGKDLRTRLNKPHNASGLSEKEVRQFVRDISSAIEYMHNQRIIHRDLKPENILKKGDIYKISDLGYAKDFKDSQSIALSYVGTAQYLAPELFINIPYTKAVDYWSFGVLLIEVCSGRRPFFHDNLNREAELFEKLKHVKKSEHIGATYDNRTTEMQLTKGFISTRISPVFINYLTQFCRVILEYESEKRLQPPSPYIEGTTFQMIRDFMLQPIIHVLDVASCLFFSVRLDPGHPIQLESFTSHMKQKFQIQSPTPLILLAIKPAKIMNEQDLLLMHQKVNEEYRPTMYVFDRNIKNNRQTGIYLMSPKLPGLLRALAAIDKQPNQDERIWREALAYIDKDHRRFEYLIMAAHRLMELINEKKKEFDDLIVRKMDPRIQQLDTCIQFLREDTTPSFVEFVPTAEQERYKIATMKQGFETIVHRIDECHNTVPDVDNFEQECRALVKLYTDLLEQFYSLKQKRGIALPTTNFETYRCKFVDLSRGVHRHIERLVTLYNDLENFAALFDDILVSSDQIQDKASSLVCESLRQAFAPEMEPMPDYQESVVTSIRLSSLEQIEQEIQSIDSEFRSLVFDAD